ncbi:phosphatidylserine/phosphatidylglycerophosphate/cardiolipin synthase family protein [Candidatus Saccharibacteria bacterium]|nr:phosphatidylserine/phosphatidylglycerophosphate/cardiolipin synthase family protein [Candidatus Saccharibacteria bacterium]
MASYTKNIMTTFRQVDIAEYADEISSRLDRASKHVLLETMSINNDGAEIEQIWQGVIKAVQRGVAVTLVYDRFSAFDALLYSGVSGLRRLSRLEQRLEKAGVMLHKVGRVRLNPFSGRHHAKAVVIDDDIYIGGGINLMQQSFATHDYMLHFNDSILAQQLYTTLPKYALDRTHTPEICIDSQTRLVFDPGDTRQSPIIDNVFESLVDGRKVWYASKLMPDRALHKSMQVISKKIYKFNRIKTASLFDKVALLLDGVRYGTQTQYRGMRQIHAKAIVTQKHNGESTVITGSHNFNSRGVRFGTQEVALISTSKELVATVARYIENL